MFMPVQSIFAAMVGTEAVLGNEEMQSAREKIRLFLDRRDVQDVLTSRGIDPMEAKARVNSLSDAEVQAIADKIDRMPAGGGFLGSIVIIAVVFFLVLIVLDLIGVTDIFTFIHPPKK
jgi:hypothetical protein